MPIVSESEPGSGSIPTLKLIVITHGLLQSMPAVGNNTVASQLLGPGVSALWISATVTKDVEGSARLGLFSDSRQTADLVHLRKRHQLTYHVFSLALAWLVPF